MSATQSNKELLEIILEQTKENARNQLNFAGKVSDFMNKQELFNAEIRGYLESNSRTNQKGLIEQVKCNTLDITQIITDKKIDKAKIGVIGVIIGAVMSLISKIFF